MANVLATQSRVGDWTSSAAMLNQVGRWRVSLIGIPTAEFEDTARSITLVLELSSDSGATWREKYAIRWVGGHYVGKDGTINPPPTLIVDLTPYIGQRARVTGSVPIATTFGIDLTRL